MEPKRKGVRRKHTKKKGRKGEKPAFLKSPPIVSTSCSFAHFFAKENKERGDAARKRAFLHDNFSEKEKKMVDSF